MVEEDEAGLASFSRAPGEGERRAVTGYHGQYRIAASLILRGLRDGTLQWIRILDPSAGRVDDVQIGSQLRVDAYQIKWSQYGGNFTFQDLVRSLGRSPSLLAQLTDGWRRLRLAFPSHRVVVHLTANATPSIDDRLPAGDVPPAPGHFAAFLAQAWRPFREAPSDSAGSVPPIWQQAWRILESESGLGSDEFMVFVRDCELQFGFEQPTGGPLTLDDQIAQEELQLVADFLFDAAADPERPMELTRDELVARLGWEDRLGARSLHEFPVDDAVYVPIDSTVQQLENALNDLVGGYVGVLGSPGSGKSMLLTQTLRSRPERLVRYYAYVPGSSHPAVLRGESSNFLHDVVLALEDAGFRPGRAVSPDDRELLLQRFHEQLGLLHESWRETGLKTVIMIDGLDHIAREQRPVRSLLSDLPRPDEVPDGVFIVLGTQTDQLRELPDGVQHAIQETGRRVEMEALSRVAVMRVLEQASFTVSPSENQRERIYELSQGHPLALVYLVKRLEAAANTRDLDSILDDTVRYEGSIEEQYHSYWRQIDSDGGLVHFLGMLARLRHAIDLSWVETWAAPAMITTLRRQLRHYFRAESHDRWYFFHNSFRLYVLDRTEESSPGTIDPSRDRDFHRELADRCAEQGVRTPWRWEELYHRFSAGEHETVLDRATQGWFRQQLFDLRPRDAIDADIKLALESAAELRDPIALVRVLLAGAELAQRSFHLETAPLIDLLLQLDRDLAAVHIHDDNRLRVAPATALSASVALRNGGSAETAARIFRLAEPLDILSDRTPMDDDTNNEKTSLLEAWARAAVHFKSLEDVVVTLRGLRRTGDRFNQQDEETSTRALQNHLIYEIGVELMDGERWDDVALMADEFDPDDPRDFEWWFWLHAHAWQGLLSASDQDQSRGFLERTLTRVTDSDLGPEERVAVAEGVFRTVRDEEQTRGWLRGVPEPELRTDLVSARDSGLSPFLQRFRLNRLRYALGGELTAAEIVPEAGQTRHRGIASFERALCVLARIWGIAWHGRQLGVAEILAQTTPILRLFNHHWRETRDWSSWYVAEGVRGEFYTLLVDACAQHGPEPIEAIRAAFEREWDDPDTAKFWPTDVRRQVIVAFARHGCSLGWVANRLRQLEDVLQSLDVYSRVEECQKQANAWLYCGDQGSARDALAKMLRVSFAVGYRKDYQLDTWIEWLRAINDIEDDEAATRIDWFARAITTLDETTEGRAGTYAAKDLIAAAHPWSPRRAVALARFLLDEGVARHKDAVGVLLRAALEGDQPPTRQVAVCLAHFALPIAVTAEPDLPALTVEQSGSSGDSQVALETARYILRWVDTYALPSSRPSWRRGVGNGLVRLGLDTRQAGLPPDQLAEPEREGEYSSDWLKLADGSRLGATEVRQRCSSIPELLALREQEAADSSFDWRTIVDHLAQNASPEECRALVTPFGASSRSAEILAVVGERLSQLGYTQEAWLLGQQILAQSKAYGWDPWYDGGSRIAAFKTLIRADPRRGRDLAWETLVKDLTREYWYPQTIALHLLKILPLLCEDIPVQEIWAEVEAHVRSLFENSSVPEGGPPSFDRRPSRDTAEMAIADLIALHIDDPVVAVGQGAQKAFGELLLAGDPAARQATRGLLNGTESEQEHVLMVLHAVSLRKPEALTHFQDIIVSLHASPNYGIQQAASVICDGLSWEPPTPGRPPADLPPIYRIALPSSATEPTSGWRVSQEGTLPEPRNPIETVAPWNFHLEPVAREAGVPHINTCHRAVQIMRNMEPETSWSQHEERRLQDRLDAIGLRLTYRRPRSMLARRAMLHVMVELIDAGALGPDNIRRLKEVMRFYDPNLILAEPSSRPSDIQPASRSELGTRSEEWLAELEAAFGSIAQRTAGGLAILAEESTLKRLEWATPTETRRSVVRTRSILLTEHIHDDGSFFAKATNRLVTEYPDLVDGSETPPLVGRHEAYGFESRGVNWLAVSPFLARGLGWVPAENGLFGWVNGHGETMVESVWWVDGLLGQPPPHFDDEVGEGWLVLASEAGWRAIVSELGSLIQATYVKRSYLEDGRLEESEMYRDLPIQ